MPRQKSRLVDSSDFSEGPKVLPNILYSDQKTPLPSPFLDSEVRFLKVKRPPQKEPHFKPGIGNIPLRNFVNFLGEAPLT